MSGPAVPAHPRAVKPLGRKAYGHIGHLPQSRMGPGDHKVHAGQARICCERARDRHDRIIVQEKLDGSCVSVARVGGQIVPLVRAGYPAASSPYEQHALFHAWAWENWHYFDALLGEGERLVGEWLAQAHGTRYALPHGPFVAFDLMTEARRVPFDEFRRRVEQADLGFTVPRLLSDGDPFSVEQALEAIAVSGHGARDPVEGAVWRVERKGEVDFLAKYVRPDKVDGCFLPDVSGCGELWNWRPGWPMGRLAAPWSKAEVEALNEFQERGDMHPFTCGNGCGTLTATLDGWFCPCGYTQGWAWAWMAQKGRT